MSERFVSGVSAEIALHKYSSFPFLFLVQVFAEDVLVLTCYLRRSVIWNCMLFVLFFKPIFLCATVFTCIVSIYSDDLRHFPTHFTAKRAACSGSSVSLTVCATVIVISCVRTAKRRYSCPHRSGFLLPNVFNSQTNDSVLETVQNRVI